MIVGTRVSRRVGSDASRLRDARSRGASLGAAILVALAVSGCASAPAREKLPEVSSWVDLEGERRAPLSVPPGRAHVLVFLTPTCPIANTYAPEIRRIVSDYADQPVAFFLVHVDPDLTVEELAEHTADYGFECPVLFDPSSRLVKATGVTVTPEAVVLTASLDRGAVPAYDVRYRGRIDDLYTDFGKRRQSPTTRDLRNALDAVLGGKKVEVTRTPAIGCPIPEGS